MDTSFCSKNFDGSDDGQNKQNNSEIKKRIRERFKILKISGQQPDKPIEKMQDDD